MAMKSNAMWNGSIGSARVCFTSRSALSLSINKDEDDLGLAPRWMVERLTSQRPGIGPGTAIDQPEVG